MAKPTLNKRATKPKLIRPAKPKVRALLRGKLTEPLQIEIYPAFRARFDKLSGVERAQLKASIKKRGGLEYPIILCRDWNVSDTLWIVDGHNRFEICVELGITPQIHINETLHSEQDVLDLIDELQLGRRNLPLLAKIAHYKKSTDYQREFEAARIRKSKHLMLDPGYLADSDTEHYRMVDIIGTRCGCAPEIARKALKVLERGSKEVIERILSGELGITEAHRIVVPKKLKPLPAGKDLDDAGFYDRTQADRQVIEKALGRVQLDIRAALFGPEPYPSAVGVLERLRRTLANSVAQLNQDIPEFKAKEAKGPPKDDDDEWPDDDDEGEDNK